MLSKKLRLFAIGLCMGIADLIPGISGGTVAFVCGIYEDLLASIQSLRLQSFKNIHWRFLIPLGVGMATAIMGLGKCFHYLLLHYTSALYAVFFGMIAASAFFCSREARITKPLHFFSFLFGSTCAFWLSGLSCSLFLGGNFFSFILAGMLGSAAMLLPGISGSFLLQVLGVYPIVLAALAQPAQLMSVKVLSSLGVGIALGFIVFSRVISLLLTKFRHLTLSLLVGFMVGGLRALWPFFGEEVFQPVCLIAMGFGFAVLIELKFRKLRGTIV